MPFGARPSSYGGNAAAGDVARKSTTAAILFVVMLSTVLPGVGVAWTAYSAWTQRKPSPTSTAAPPPRPVPMSTTPAPSGGLMAHELTSWAGNPGAPICVLDADADGVADPVGWASPHGLTAVSGATGAVLWSDGDTDSRHRRLVCDQAARALLIANAADLTVTSLAPQSGQPRWSVKLPDQLEEIGFAASCIALRAANGARASVDAESGKPATCSAPTRPARYGPALKSIRARDLDVSLRAAGAGTPRLVVEARAASAVVWSTTLPEIAAGMSAGTRADGAIAADGNVVYAIGQKHGGPGLVVVALDAATGKILARREESHVTKNDGFFIDATAVTKLLFVESFGMLHAYDAATLERRWWAGKMWAGRL